MVATIDLDSFIAFGLSGRCCNFAFVAGLDHYRQTFVGKVMSLLLNILSRLVINFLPRSKRLLISWLQSPSAVISETPKIKSDTSVMSSSLRPHGL